MTNYRDRLSEVQKEILCAIANNTINTSECQDAYSRYGVYHPHHYPYNHEWKDKFMAYSVLVREVCSSYWDDGKDQSLNPNDNIRRNHSRKATFSESLHNLVEKKGLVVALALGWIVVNKEGYYDRLKWQGGGHKKVDETLGDTPRFKLLCLSFDGWKFVREEFDSQAGLCPFLREKLKEGNELVTKWWEGPKNEIGPPLRRLLLGRSHNVGEGPYSSSYEISFRNS